jgi:hypothetical protein
MWDESKHPRGAGGKFARLADRAADVNMRSTRGPHQLSAAEFEATVPRERRLYRGVTNADAAAHTRAGGLGGGDYGRGIYMGTGIAVAQGYAQGTNRGHQGVVLRGAIDPGANVQEPPRKVARGGSAAIDKWADETGVDVVDLGDYQVIRNPAVLTFDGHDYTLDESVVLDYASKGYILDDPKYAGAVAAVKRLHAR